MASATTDLRLPSQPQNVTAHRPVRYRIILLGDSGHTDVNNLPTVVTWLRSSRQWNQRPQLPTHSTFDCSTVHPSAGGRRWHAGSHRVPERHHRPRITESQEPRRQVHLKRVRRQQRSAGRHTGTDHYLRVSQSLTTVDTTSHAINIILYFVSVVN